MSLETRKNALEDPGADMLDKMTSVWDRYGRIVLVILGAAAVVGVVAYFSVSAQARQENSASEKLAQASDLFWKGDYDRSRTMAQEISQQFGGTPSGVDAHRIAGDDAFWRGKWKEAIVDYKAFLSKKNSGLLAQAVQRSLAYAYEGDGQPAEAAKLYDGLVGVFDRESSGEMLMAAARSHHALHKDDIARQRLQRLIDEFGDSTYQLKARVMLAELTPESK